MIQFHAINKTTFSIRYTIDGQHAAISCIRCMYNLRVKMYKGDAFLNVRYMRIKVPAFPITLVLLLILGLSFVERRILIGVKVIKRVCVCVIDKEKKKMKAKNREQLIGRRG